MAGGERRNWTLIRGARIGDKWREKGETVALGLAEANDLKRFGKIAPDDEGVKAAPGGARKTADT